MNMQRHCLSGFVILSLMLAPPDADAVDGAGDRFAAPGSLISVGQHRLHMHCIGEGSPTVIFDSGLGGSSLDWVRVQPEVASFTRACSYDRAGYGWSDSGPRPRDSRRISSELEALLTNSNEAEPYVLVGHSFGGFNVRLYSHDHPGQVVGLVLIDSSHEDQFRLFDEAGVGSTAPRHGSFVLRNSLEIPDGLPADVAHVAQLFAIRRSSMTAFRSELEHLRRSAAQTRNATLLSDIPLVVISHRIVADTLSATKAKRAELWMDMQSDLAHRSALGIHVIAETEDHYIHLNQPQLIVDWIREMTEQSRVSFCRVERRRNNRQD